MVYIDEVEVDQEGIAEIMLDENAIAQVARECCHKAATFFIYNSSKTPLIGCSTLKILTALFMGFFRTRNIPEAPWNKSGWRTYSSCQVRKY